MFNKAILFFSCLTLNISASTLLQETFETENGIVPGSISGQNNWNLSGGTASVQSNVVYDGFQALEMTQAEIVQNISTTNQTIWIRFMARISDAPESDPGVADPDTSAGFYIGTNLHIHAYSNEVPVDLGVAISTNVWTRFDMFCDYVYSVWNLSMNGTTIGANLPLYSTETATKSILFSNEESASTYIDQIALLDHELASDAPDLDFDRIPDWWELRNFGNITGADANAISGNSGMSFLETYIAGVQPFAMDPVMVTHSGTGHLIWDSKPGRCYEIEWTPDLSTNFTPIASVAWPVDEFVDLTNATGNAGFYRLNISVP
ncbi:hypothetical protein P4B35_11610 [Pontiellaceae bacterium B12227]|nr:hypothetical protein [Pontiellaceae bacterium B12227]